MVRNFAFAAVAVIAVGLFAGSTARATPYLITSGTVVDGWAIYFDGGIGKTLIIDNSSEQYDCVRKVPEFLSGQYRRHDQVREGYFDADRTPPNS